MITRQGKPMIAKLTISDEETFFPTMLINRGCMYTKRLDKMIFSLVESGLYNLWYERTMVVLSNVTYNELYEVHQFPVNLSDVQSPFYLLLFGLTLSVITFLCEIIKHACFK